MEVSKWRSVFPAYLLAIGLFVLDQVTKTLVEWGMSGPGSTIEIIEVLDLFRLTYVINPGAAWGILPGFQPLFIAVALLVAAVCVWAIQTRPRDPIRYAWACWLAGSLGNMVDRLLTHRGVVDFVDMGIKSYRWPTYNVADASLTIGFFWLCYYLVFKEFRDDAEPDDDA